MTYPVDPYFTGPGTISPNAEQRDRKDTYVEQWVLSVQRELPANFVSSVSYLGSHGVHLLETNVVNLINPATGIAQYPAFAPAIGWRGSIGASSYNGLSVSVRRPFTNGLLVAANYAYTHEIDNGSNGSGDGDEISPQNAFCLSCEWASGAWDATHVLNGNAVYELPFGLGKPMLNERGIGSAIAGNWQLTTTALARTGFPVNVLLPSSYVAPAGTPARSVPTWFEASLSLRQGARESQSGLIPRRLLSRLENSAPRRVTSFADPARGRSISAPPRRLHWQRASSWNSARSSTTSSITRS